jgi:hypothetical protein
MIFHLNSNMKLRGAQAPATSKSKQKPAQIAPRVVQSVQAQKPVQNVQPMKLATSKKKVLSDKEWAARHGRGFIEAPKATPGPPVRLPVKEQNARRMVTATPPTGTTPDPNNAGNILICHQKPDLSYVTLSIPPASLPLYQTVNNSDGVCAPAGNTFCPPGSAPDCAGVCNGTSIVDCDGNCYDPVTTPAAWLLDCANVCYDTTTIPLNVPDCNGVCGGSSVVDCAGVCDGTLTVDCAGVCDGNHYVDCGGNCNSDCAEVVAGGLPNKAKPAPMKTLPPSKVTSTPSRSVAPASQSRTQTPALVAAPTTIKTGSTQAFIKLRKR